MNTWKTILSFDENKHLYSVPYSVLNVYKLFVNAYNEDEARLFFEEGNWDSEDLKDSLDPYFDWNELTDEGEEFHNE